MKKIFRNSFAAAALLLGTSLLITACSENNDAINPEVPVVTPEEKPETTTEYVTVPYTVSAGSEGATRAHTPGGFDYTTLKFSEGDRLYVQSKKIESSKEFLCYGTLTMTSGADSNSATFSGTLNVPAGHELSDFQNVYYVLVSEDDEMGIWNDDKLDLEQRKTPCITKDISDAVECYSYIGYQTGEGFAQNIQLAQLGSFVVFDLNLPLDKIFIDKVSAISATFKKYSDGSNVTINSYSGFLIDVDPAETLHFVVPFDVASTISGAEKITALHVEITTLTSSTISRTLTLDVPCGDGKVMQSGRVYTIADTEVPVPTPLVDPQVGEIVTYNGIEGMVVKLDDGTKVVIATQNWGATDPNDSGTKMTYTDAKTQVEAAGWYIPTKEQVVSFFARNGHNPAKVVISGEAPNLRNWASYEITTSHDDKYLDFEFAIGSAEDQQTQFDDYWTSTVQYAHTYHTFGFEFAYSEEEADVVYFPYYATDASTNELYVRAFHVLE